MFEGHIDVEESTIIHACRLNIDDHVVVRVLYVVPCASIVLPDHVFRVVQEQMLLLVTSTYLVLKAMLPKD